MLRSGRAWGRSGENPVREARSLVSHFPGGEAERWISLGSRRIVQYIIKVAAMSAPVRLAGRADTRVFNPGVPDGAIASILRKNLWP